MDNNQLIKNNEIINNYLKISNEKLTAALAIYSITNTDKNENYKIALKYCIEALNTFKYIFKFYRYNEDTFENIMETFDCTKLFFSDGDKGLKLILENQKKYIHKFILLDPIHFNFSDKEKYPYTNIALDSLFNKN